jgi:endonuclease III
MALQENRPLINIEGKVYRLSKRDYDHFQKVRRDALKAANPIDGSEPSDAWSELLHWVEEHGKYVCRVETYNY